ncbi:MAG: polysaccharide biosynthesis/export family protein [Phycisphaerales bacterium]|nr:polysaccharide biosynthesis/export family protein [Phycisphaerales bacterium]
MAQNAENIEAKLCAYVDGELDAKGRAEIEKHLQSNPQHRKLLEALSRTHRFVAELPREKAPPEILENLQSQLERAVLLGDVGDEESDGVPRISRWPQIMSLAAIVLLTVGLGVILYFMLPPLGRQVDSYSIVQDAPVATRPAEMPQPALQEAAAVPKDNAKEGSAARSALSARNTNISPTHPRQDEIDVIQVVRRRLSAAANETGSPNAQPHVLLVVNTDDPSTTQRQLVGYLQNNQIQWKAVGQEIATTRPDQSAAGMEQSFAAPASPTTTTAQELEATTQPAEPSKVAHDQNQMAESDDLIVCPNMTIQQANELAGALPMWRQGQRALVVSYFDAVPAPADSQPTSAPSPEPIPSAVMTEQQVQTTQPAGPTTLPATVVEPRILQTGDRVHIQIALEADLELKKEIPIGQGGTIILPLVGEIQAVGQTEAQLAEAIAEAYRTRNISQQPRVKVSYLDPADQPPPVAVAIYLQNEIVQPTPSAEQPTTSPSEPTTAPAEPTP